LISRVLIEHGALDCQRGCRRDCSAQVGADQFPAFGIGQLTII
jgi:hypothetical protein